jgi:hypothetical protein
MIKEYIYVYIYIIYIYKHINTRSAALLMIKEYQQALDDCKKAIELDSTFVKAYIRGHITIETKLDQRSYHYLN